MEEVDRLDGEIGRDGEEDDVGNYINAGGRRTVGKKSCKDIYMFVCGRRESERRTGGSQVTDMFSSFYGGNSEGKGVS